MRFPLSSLVKQLSQPHKKRKPTRVRLNVGDLEERAVPSGNDFFADATVIAPNSLPFSDTGTTAAATGETGEAALSIVSAPTMSHWYSFTPAVSGLYQIDTFDSTLDTIIGLTSSTSVNGVIYSAVNDDVDFDNDVFSSQIQAVLNAGTTYHIVVDGYRAETGAYNLNLDFLLPVPTNDNFAAATGLPALASTCDTGYNINATSEPGEPSNFYGTSEPIQSMWWNWTAPSSGTVTVDTLGSNFDTTLGVYTGAAVSALTLVVANEDGAGIAPASLLTFTATAGVTYHISVDGYQANVGIIVLNLSLAGSTSSAPILSTNLGAVSANEGNVVSNSGTVSDPDNDTVTLTSSLGSVINNGNGTWSWSLLATDGPTTPTTPTLVTITGNDCNGNTTTTSFTYSVNNVAPTVTSPNSANVAENTTAVLTVTSTDPGVLDPASYSILAGGDGAFFTIDSSTGALSFTSTPNFETPGDVGGDGVYNLTIQVDDGDGGLTPQAIAVTITNVTPATPVDTNNTNNTVAEGAAAGTVVGVTAFATDPAGAQAGGLVYTLVGGNGAFQIDPTTGVVSVANGALLDGPNSYPITVQAYDGSLTATQSFVIDVTNAVPTATSSVSPQYDPIIVRNSPYTFALSNIVDPAQAADTYSITWNFGDGSPTVTQSGLSWATVSSGSVGQTYSFPNTGSYTVTMTMSDSDGATTTYSYGIEVRAALITAGGELHVGGTTGNNAITLNLGLIAGAVNVIVDGVNYGSFTFSGAVRTFAGGGSDTVTILGTTGNDTFALGGTVASDLTINGRLYTTLSVESYNLQSLAGNDAFHLGTSSLPGVINGGTGTDTLNVGTGNVTLTNNTNGTTAAVSGGFVGFESFVSNGGTLTGPNTTNTWVLTGLNQGTLNTTTLFSGFANYNGGTGQDRLKVYQGSVSGVFNGGGGSDTLDYKNVTMPNGYSVTAALLANGLVRSGLVGNPLMHIMAFEKVQGCR